MQEADLRGHLLGCDRRSVGGADAAARAVIDRPALLGPLIALLADGDPLVRMRAADAAEKATRNRHAILQPLTEQVLEAAGHPQQEVRWHALQMLPRLALAGDALEQAFTLAQASLAHPSRIVQCEALTALFALSGQDPARRALALAQAEVALTKGPPSLRARARQLMLPIAMPLG